MNTKDLLHKISGRKWKPAKPGRRWQDNPQFTQYFDTSICPAHETGVAGAIRNAAGGKPLAKGVAIGAGTGQNERALVGAGLVEHFDLYEVSADRIATARQQAAEAGMSEHFSEYLEDALLSDKIEEYDLVYWQMSLHHMFDVDHAIAWSVRALKPGGLLVINDYIGPTRLQWTKTEISTVRKFLEENRPVIQIDPRRVRGGSRFRRFKQFLRDPSESPQSDKIPLSYKRHTGEDLNILGGAMIHLCGGFLFGTDKLDPTIHDRLIALDQQMRDRGIHHFAFGCWQKPAPTTS